MRIGKRSLGRRQALILLFGLFCAVMALVAAPSALEDGPLAVAAVIFAFLLLFIFLVGLVVFWSMRRMGQVPRRKVLLGVVTLCALLSLGLIAGSLAFPQYLTLDLGDDYSFDALGISAVLVILFLVLLFVALAVMIAAFGMLWLFCGVVSFLLPRFLARVKGANFDGSDSWGTRAACWLVDIPWVLDPSTLRLDLPREGGILRRWYESVVWQMAFGLLLAVYISLNPVLLQSMDFAQTFGLLSLSSLAIPLLILPWSTLEAVGARVKGVKYDFPLHEGAKSRTLQTMVALGTIFLIVRLAVEDVGAEAILLRFTGYALLLLLLSSLVSFVYFNYFERDLVAKLIIGLKDRGVA